MKSHRFAFFVFTQIIVVICMANSLQAQTYIEITAPMTPPGWALMEREILCANAKAIEDMYAKYFDERGYYLHTLRWGILDGPDDCMELFMNWTLLYSLGASESVLELYKKAYDGHILQYTEYKTVDTPIGKDGCYYKEFITQSDFFHTAEGLRAFNIQGLADPTDIKYQKRTRRFSGFYMDEDPDAKNYDPEHKIIRSIWTGSRGPMLRMATQVDWVGDPVVGTMLTSHTGIREPVDFMETYDLMLAHCDEYLNSAGDHPLNLGTTNFALNAYALAHETKYKDWLLEYVDAWAERIDKNGGNIPTNIGLDGTIGGEFKGRWYGGTYGWDFSPWDQASNRQSYRNTFDCCMWPGFGNALMISGDQKYTDVLRRQMDNLYAQKKIIDGRVMIPDNFGRGYDKKSPPKQPLKEGQMMAGEDSKEEKWYNYTPNLFIGRLTEIYMWSMDRKDLERIPTEGWIGFIEGKNPNYPEQALRNEFASIRRSMERMRNDITTPDTRIPDRGGRDPSAAHELLKLMQGAYLTSNVWMIHARVRYFDPVRNRSGIPEDVASLVTEMNKEMTKVTLVNVNQVEPRDVIVQTGAYGEHQCTRVEIGGKTYSVNNRLFNVHLAPGAGAELVIYANRYVNPPTLSLPWHGDTVPMP